MLPLLKFNDLLMLINIIFCTMDLQEDPVLCKSTSGHPEVSKYIIEHKTPTLNCVPKSSVS